MDFGALCCKPSAPSCHSCPLAETCQALREHSVGRLPVKAKRTAVRDRYLTYIYIRTDDGRTLLHRRGGGDIWQGLFEFPVMESGAPLALSEVEQRVRDRFHFPHFTLHSIAHDVCHRLTHQCLHADFYRLILPSWEGSGSHCLPATGDCLLVRESDLDRYALPRLLEKMLGKLLICK